MKTNTTTIKKTPANNDSENNNELKGACLTETVLLIERLKHIILYAFSRCLFVKQTC